jgi:hypothetical protein
MFGRLAKFRGSGGQVSAENEKARHEAEGATEQSDSPSSGIEVKYEDSVKHGQLAAAIRYKKFEKDGYIYPNLFQEADEMMLVALLMYTFTDLRTMARQNKLPDRSILSLPITLDCVAHNRRKHYQNSGCRDRTRDGTHSLAVY